MSKKTSKDNPSEPQNKTYRSKGVAWIITEKLCKTVDYKACKFNRIIAITLQQHKENQNTKNPVILTQIYAPTQDNKDESLENFFDALNEIAKEPDIVAGDFNEKICHSNYCCISSRKQLSSFCSEQEYVLTNMWPSMMEPVTKARTDFILMRKYFWKDVCALSCKDFSATSDSDHMFPVVAVLKMKKMECHQTPAPSDEGQKIPITEPPDQNQIKPILPYMGDKAKKEFCEKFKDSKKEAQISWTKLKDFISELLEKKRIVLNNSLLRLPASKTKNDEIANAVCGRLLEVAFPKQSDMNEKDKKQLQTIIVRIEADDMKDVVKLVNNYKTTVRQAASRIKSAFGMRKTENRKSGSRKAGDPTF